MPTIFNLVLFLNIHTSTGKLTCGTFRSLESFHSYVNIMAVKIKNTFLTPWVINVVLFTPREKNFLHSSLLDEGTIFQVYLICCRFIHREFLNSDLTRLKIHWEEIPMGDVAQVQTTLPKILLIITKCFKILTKILHHASVHVEYTSVCVSSIFNIISTLIVHVHSENLQHQSSEITQFIHLDT